MFKRLSFQFTRHSISFLASLSVSSSCSYLSTPLPAGIDLRLLSMFAFYPQMGFTIELLRAALDRRSPSSLGFYGDCGRVNRQIREKRI